MRDRRRCNLVGKSLVILQLALMILVEPPLAAQISFQPKLDDKDSQVSLIPLRDRIFCDSDWIPVLLTIGNRSAIEEGIFEIEIETETNAGIDRLFWRGSISVPAGEEIQRVVGIPISWNWYQRWKDSLEGIVLD